MWDVVKDGVQHSGGKWKTSGRGSAVALSSGQETATVSAVSLMANELPEGGGGGGRIRVCVRWQVLGRVGNKLLNERKVKDVPRKKKVQIKKTTRMLWEPMCRQFQDHSTGRAAFTTLLWLHLPAVLCQPPPFFYRCHRGGSNLRHPQCI